MTAERQTAWGRLVILDIFLGGIGAGIFPISFTLILLDGMREMAATGAMLGPVFVILGLFFLILKLGSPMKAYLVFSGLPGSWMSRGALIQIFYIIFGFGYSIPAFWTHWWLRSGFGLVIGIIAFILSLIIAFYHGLLLSKSIAIPLWSASGLPVLFFFAALCTGIGSMLLIFVGYARLYPVLEIVRTFTILSIVGIAFIIIQLITLWSLLSLRLSITYGESIKILSVSAIWATFCLILPLILLASGLWGREGIHLLLVSGFSGILLLASGFIIRYSAVKAGHYYSLQVPLAR